MHLRQSPLARTPPTNLPVIPGVTVKKDANATESNDHNDNSTSKLTTVKGNNIYFTFIITFILYYRI